jgi:hypothetical protein
MTNILLQYVVYLFATTLGRKLRNKITRKKSLRTRCLKHACLLVRLGALLGLVVGGHERAHGGSGRSGRRRTSSRSPPRSAPTPRTAPGTRGCGSATAPACARPRSVVGADVSEHLMRLLLEPWLRVHHGLLLLRRRRHHHRKLEGAQPHGVHLHLPVDELHGVPDLVQRQQHVLDHMVVVVVLPDGLALGDLEQRDHGRHEPAQEEPEPELVGEGHDELGFPLQARLNEQRRLKMVRI